MVSVDAAGLVVYLNTAAELRTGGTGASALGRPARDVVHLVHAATRLAIPNQLLDALARDAEVCGPADSVLIDRLGHDLPAEDSTAPIHDGTGALIGAVMVFRHVGAALAQSRRMAHAALHDGLTQLPNRTLLLDRLTTALALASRRDRLPRASSPMPTWRSTPPRSAGPASIGCATAWPGRLRRRPRDGVAGVTGAVLKGTDTHRTRAYHRR